MEPVWKEMWYNVRQKVEDETDNYLLLRYDKQWMILNIKMEVTAIINNKLYGESLNPLNHLTYHKLVVI